MADLPISSLTVLVGTMPAGSYLEVSIPDGTSSTGFATYRATPEQIAATITGYVPTTRAINTGDGLTGGGTLASDLTLGLDINDLTTKTAMAVADYFAISSVADGNTPAKATFPNAMKALTGLTTLAIPSLTDDFLIINHAADGLTYKIAPSALGLAAGNVPAGGTTGQILAKLSNTDYATTWSDPAVTLNALSLAGNPTAGAALSTSVTLGATLAFSGSSLQTGAGTGDVSWSANSFVTAIGANKVTDAMLRQSAGLSLIGRSTNSTGNVADITAASDLQVFRRSGTSIGFGSIDLSSSTVVGSSLLPLANGGTNAALVASNGGIFYSTATAGAVLAGTATSGQVLRSGASAAPSWSTTTYPATAAAGTVLAATVANAISATATPILGVAGTTLGTLGLAGNTSGTVTLTPQATAGTVTLTLPNTSGTIAASATAPITLSATTGAIGITGSALTRVDDTNVTLTLGGTPTTALLQATSLTLGWTGQLGLTRGGTAASLTASNGGIVYSTASALAILAGTATAGQMLRSGSSTTPAWSTSTFPATSAAGTILASLTANTVTATSAPVLGIAGTTLGTLSLTGNTSGTILITPQATAGSPTLALPNTTGTFAVGATSPLTLSATTGNLTITTGTLTKGDDTNVTLTLGGTPTNALLNAVSITAGWTGQLSVARGGTGVASLTAYGVLCGGTTTTGAVQALAALGASGTVLTSNGAGALPSFQAVAGTGTVTSISADGGAVTGTGAAITSSGTVYVQQIEPGGRLTVTSGAPVMTANATAQTTIYYAPYKHGFCPLYNGTVMRLYSFLSSATDTTGLSISLASSANWVSGSLYDLFVTDDSGTMRLVSGPAWSSSTSRGTGAGTTELERYNGIWVNKVSMTGRYGAASTMTVGVRNGTYVGTMYMTAAGQTGMNFNPAAAAGGNANILGVYNAYNRERTIALCRDSTATWTNTSATWRAADNNTNNSITYIDGLANVAVDASYSVAAFGDVASAFTVVIGVNRDSSTATPDFQSVLFGANVTAQPHARATFLPSLGLHVIYAMEASAGGGNTADFYGSGWGSAAGQTEWLEVVVAI